MRALANKLKPAGGYSQVAHVGINVFLPLLVLVFVRVGLPEVAASLVIISKWRMFSVKPRHWWAIIQANLVDIFAGLSFVAFIANNSSTAAANLQIMWTILYIGWLVFIKPGSTTFKTALQAFIAQGLAINAVLILFSDVSVVLLMAMISLVAYGCARHFFVAFEEDYSQAFAIGWAYCAAALTWVLSHWLLWYQFLGQTTVVISLLALSMGTIYYLDHHDRLGMLIRRQLLFILSAALVVIVVFSDWSDKTI